VFFDCNELGKERDKGIASGLSSWGDENHPKTGFKLIPFLFLIM